MSVRIKIFLCLAGVAGALWIATAYLASSVFLERFDQMDSQRVGVSLGRVREGLKDRERQMLAAVRMWLRENPDTAFDQSASEFLNEFNLNLLAEVDATGKIRNVLLRKSPGGENRLSITDEAVLAGIGETSSGSTGSSGILETSLGAMIYAVGTNSDGISAVAGLFVGGEYELQLRNALLSDVTILPASGSVMTYFSKLPPESQNSVIPFPGPKDTQIAAYSLVRDRAGKPIIALKVSEARHSYLDGTANLRFFLGISLAFAVATVMIATFLVELFVTGRIRRLTNSARRADINNMDDLPEAFVQGNDEISVLARTTKMMVDRLKSSQLLYRAVVETQSELIVRFNPDGEITLANDAFAAFFGRHIKGVVKKNLRDFFTPDSIGGVDILEWIPTRTGRSTSRDFMVTLEDGKECWLQWHQRALFDDNGNLTEIQATGQDITERLNNERQLQSARDAAEAANRSKNEFLTVMSHEIRTPLTNVLGFTSILERTPLTSEQSEYLGLVRSGGNYLLMLLNDLLDYTSVSSGRLDLHPETISVSEVAHEIIATHTPEARAKSLDLDVDVDVDIPALIEADPGRLRQVLQNVVSNGIKFTDRGFVRLSVKAGKPGFLEFLVQDTGPGIPPDAIPHIFEAFGATSESNSRGHGGAKVGLAVTHKILERMGGTITVKSHPGIGSLFTISIPIGNPKPHVKAPTTQLPDREPSSMEFSTMNLKVLAVDDNDVNRKVLQRLLGMIGIQCDAATGGRECLEMSASHAYDVIFLDIQMPEMDGFETVGKLRAREKETGADPTHVIAYTAFTLPGDRDRCLKAGMNDYVSKPIRAGSLANAISAYLSASGKMSSGV